MISHNRSIILAAMLCIAVSGTAKAKCQKHGLLPPLRLKAPAVYSAKESAASEMPFRHGRLFRLSREGTEPSYLFGTLHLSDPRVVSSFSPRVRAALTGSKIVVLELVETGDDLRGVIAKNPDAWRRATMADEDQRADRLLSKTDFAQLEALMARKGLPESAAREFKPSTLALLLDSPDCSVRQQGARPYVDELVADVARANKIETKGLESMIEQIEILNGLPHEIERALLVAMVRQADHGEDTTKATVAPYVEGNIGDLLGWMQSAEPIPGVAEAQIPPAFLNRLITLRNYRMRDRASPILQRGGAFIAVGAAHLPGMDGLLSLIQKAGYDIETIE